jgi:ACS family D-galactonate transporter-like MFS transporter
MEANSEGSPAYRSLWVWLLLAWAASAADRTIAGPVFSYIISNNLPIIQGVENPYAVSGLVVGSLFFAGYMLTQFPGGYLGDKFGHRTIIVISMLWAALATILTGFMTAIVGLVAFRVITGLGEGTFYSNDRSLIVEQTPFEKRSFGMGVVITGLAIGITIAIISTPFLIDLGNLVLGANESWRMPFLVIGVATLVVGVGIMTFFKRQRGAREFRPDYLAALRELGKYSVVFFVIIMAAYLLARWLDLPEWVVAVAMAFVALLLVGFAFRRMGEEIAPVLYNRDLFLIYIAFIAILWNLWFFSFWSVAIVSQAAPQATFLNAALTAALNAGAGILGFPIGGWIADYAKRRGWGRKVILIFCTLMEGLLTVAFGLYIINGGQALSVMGVLLFFQAIFFFALQPMAQALAADISGPALLGAMFGMMNLVGEIGAVLSPGISGALRDATGTWNTAVMLDAGIILASAVVLLFVRESKASSAERQPPEEAEATS